MPKEYKKVRKSLVTSGFSENPVISFSVLRAKSVTVVDTILTTVILWLNVNSWGRDKKEIIASRVGVKAPARFSCMAEEDSVSEIAEITHPKADAFQSFGLVIAAFNKAIRLWDIHRIQDFSEPVVICICAVVELGQIHDFQSQQPV